MALDKQEQILLNRIAGNDSTALEELFRLYYTPLVRFVFQKVRDWDQAEDLSQEVFVRMWNKRTELVITTSLKAYLYTAAKNLALNEIQKSQRHAELNQVFLQKIEQEDVVEREAEAALWQERIEDALQELPPRCREVFVLSKFEGMSYQEIAEVMQISPKTVENQMGKALSMLRKSLAPFLEMTVLSWLIWRWMLQ